MTDLNSLSCSLAAFSELSAEILRLGKSIRFQARGNSMQPLVRDGDILLIEPLGSRSPKVGDVVLCRVQPEKVVVHRVVARRTDSHGTNYLVQGDQAFQPDGWMPVEQVIGRMVAIERFNRSLNMGNPIMRLLGMTAVLRSKSNFGRQGFLGRTTKLLKSLPILSLFLS